MKYLLASAFTIWACASYSQSANNFTNIPVRTENNYPFVASPKFQAATTTSKGLGIFFNHIEDTLALLLNHVSEKSVKKNLLFFAGDKCQGRTAGINADSITGDFIAHWMIKHELLEKLPGFVKQAVNLTDNIAVAEGSDKKAASIIFIAHRSHKPQSFDSTFYSVIDNESGTVVLLECAKAFAALSKEGIYPKRNIVFICTMDDDRSTSKAVYFTQLATMPINRIKFDLNIDILTRRLDSNKISSNYSYSLYYDNTYDSATITENVKQQSTLPVAPGKINYKLLTQKTKLALDVLWKLANN